MTPFGLSLTCKQRLQFMEEYDRMRAREGRHPRAQGPFESWRRARPRSPRRVVTRLGAETGDALREGLSVVQDLMPKRIEWAACLALSPLSTSRHRP